MDKKIIEIFKLVRELNRKGDNLSLNIAPRGIDIIDQSNDYKSILLEPNTIYFDSYWKFKYKEMVESALKILKDRLKNLAIIKEEN